MIEELITDAEKRMAKTTAALEDELKKLRAGRAHAGLLDQVMVSHYGSDVPVQQVATISVADSRTLLVTPWEKQNVAAVDKAIRSSGLGLNPAVSGVSIRVPLPALTEERRQEMVRVVRAEVEKSRVAVRNIRRDVNSDIKSLLKEKEISSDDEGRAADRVQKLTDRFVAQIDTMLEAKERDLMEV
ncbi:MAG: ribosome recycling factor [Gammaproteobacteria bacterium]|nr:ribosome recycling factor [Gammaproteobacteria bacterium]